MKILSDKEYERLTDLVDNVPYALSCIKRWEKAKTEIEKILNGYWNSKSVDIHTKEGKKEFKAYNEVCDKLKKLGFWS